MKKVGTIILLLVVNLLSISGFSQKIKEPEALGLPGDNLNLYAVLDVFQKSKTLEDFEKAINNKENHVNNLDLNNDNNVDYITVISEKEEDSHVIVLQVAINEKEKQDVAVITVTKDKSGSISIQIVGDEELYGKDYIIEPSDKIVSGTPNPGYRGDENGVINHYNYVSVNDWPVVLFLFSPIYVAYHSPFYWGFYPPYWYPWTPIFFSGYWGFHNHYYDGHHFHRAYIHRGPIYYNNYVPRRLSSTIVIQNRRNGNYNATYEGRTYQRPMEPIRSRGNGMEHGTRITPERGIQRTIPERMNRPSLPQRTINPPIRVPIPQTQTRMPSGGVRRGR